MKNLDKYSQGQVNVCGVNCFSANNTKVGKQYGKGQEQLILKKETVKKQTSNSQTREGQASLSKKGGTFGGAKRLENSDKAQKRKMAPIGNKKELSDGQASVQTKVFKLGESELVVGES